MDLCGENVNTKYYVKFGEIMNANKQIKGTIEEGNDAILGR